LTGLQVIEPMVFEDSLGIYVKLQSQCRATGFFGGANKLFFCFPY